MNAILDKFGALFVQNLRDSILHKWEMLLRGDWTAPELLELQNHFSHSGFTEEQIQVLRDVLEYLITTGMHDLLFTIQEQADADSSFKVLVDGQEITKLSDGLHGEIFGEDGWIVRFSKFPSATEIERSRRAEDFIKKIFSKKA